MGRGSSEQRDLSKQQLTTDNARTDAASADRTQARNILLPKAQELMQSPGYSDSEQGAIRGNALDSMNAGYDTGTKAIADRVATTHNAAGASANIAQMARDRATGAATTNRALTQSFADEKQRRQMAGSQLMANLYGVDTNLVGGISGNTQGDLSNYAKGITPGFGDYLSQAVSGAAGVAGSYLGRPRSG